MTLCAWKGWSCAKAAALMSAAAMVENIIFCIVILKNELFVQSLLFHFQASPDERTNALGIIVADWLAHVVVEAAIALDSLASLRMDQGQDRDHLQHSSLVRLMVLSGFTWMKLFRIPL